MIIKIDAGRVITGSDEIIDEGTIAIDGNKLTYVGSTDCAPNSDYDESWNLPNHTLLPGLIDGHTHIYHPGASREKQEYLVRRSPTKRVIDTICNIRSTVEAGFTTIRDLGSPDDIAIAVGRATDSGVFRGPRILAAGQGLTTTGGHGQWTPWFLDQPFVESNNVSGEKGIVADGPHEVRRAVREQIRRGADLIKVWGGSLGNPTLEFSRRELEEIVAEADRQGVDVAVHAHLPETIVAAVEAGAHSIEHATAMDDRAISKMANNDVFVTLTMATMKKLSTHDAVSESVQNRVAEAIENQQERVPDLLESGVPILVGTDAGASMLAHGDNGEELLELKQCGMSSQEVIQAATQNAATALRLDDKIGMLEEGLLADVIAVRGDPINDLSILANPDCIELVMREGTIQKDTRTGKT